MITVFQLIHSFILGNKYSIRADYVAGNELVLKAHRWKAIILAS